MVDSVGGKQPQTLVPSKPHHTLPVSAGFFAPALVTVVSLPLGFLFALGIQGTPLSYVIGITSFGLLTALDLKTGFVRSALGSGFAFLALSYFIENSNLAPGIASSSGLGSLVVALPPAIGVFLSTMLFSRPQRYRILKQNVLATLAMGTGLVVGASMSPSSTLVGSSPVSLSLFILVGLGANCIQMMLLLFLDKFWQTKNNSIVILPTAFFAYNAIVGYEYFTSPTSTLGYIFFSSLGFLPLLFIAAIGSSSIAVKMLKSQSRPITAPSRSSAPASAPPRISFTGDHAVKQGQVETIRITTEADGGPRDMLSIIATVQTPAGKREPLKLSHASTGKYNASYQSGKPGNYNVQVVAMNKARQSTKQSFSFVVQAPPSPPPVAHHPPPPANHPHPTTPPAPTPRVQPSPPPISRPAPTPVTKTTPVTYNRQGIPSLSLSSWDPKVWVGQDVHGYRVVEHIATGASGYVLRATFGQAGTEVALKIPILKPSVHAHVANEPTAGTITLNETMSEATRLLELSGQSKYVVQIRGILVDRLNVQEILKGDTALYYRSPPAIVMEYMKGSTAKKLIEDPSYEPLYYSEKWGGLVILVGQMIAMALDMIHKAGFVHLDVKPQNILFNTKPPVTGQEMLDKIASGELLPKLADLGSAVKKGGKVVQFTSEYAPGEQVLGDPAEPSMDVYALGASLYTMLTRTPVHSPKLIEAMNNVTTSPELNRAMKDLESAWGSFEPDFTRIDSKFSAVISVLKQMLAEDPRKRSDAGSVAMSLQKLVDKHGSLS
jgi:serine/threonine protein kinase